jgi:hypothetical protein
MSVATTKFGTARKRPLQIRTSQSVRPRRRADARPVAAPIAIAMAAAISVSWTVTANRADSSPSTGRFVANDVPRSPASARPSQERYWAGRGRSRPRSRRIASKTSGATLCEPVAATAKSPGRARTSAKAATDTPPRIASAQRGGSGPGAASTGSRAVPRAYFRTQAVRTKVRVFAARGLYPFT